MTSARPLRLVASAVALVAMAALWAAPAEHVHASPDGPSVVHRHLIDETARHADPTFDHDDHSTATTLDPVYVPEQSALVCPEEGFMIAGSENGPDGDPGGR